MHVRKHTYVCFVRKNTGIPNPTHSGSCRSQQGVQPAAWLSQAWGCQGGQQSGCTCRRVYIVVTASMHKTTLA